MSGKTHYVVRAEAAPRNEGEQGAIMTFGLVADDGNKAMLAALDRVPFTPVRIAVQPLLKPVIVRKRQ